MIDYTNINKEDYIWYVCYGSNMLYRRFLYYIRGGVCPENAHRYRGCTNRTKPLDRRPFIIDYDMYYGNYNKGAWAYSAVAFLDVTKKGFAYGRAYLITKKQFAQIHNQEGKSDSWYPHIFKLGKIDDIEAVTITNIIRRQPCPYTKLSKGYYKILLRGIKQAFPELKPKQIKAYLNKE